jgi:adenylate kinase family enzyme
LKKIIIVGPGGAGKSTLARRLGAILGLEVVHLDELYWGPGWIEPPKEAWRATIADLLRRDAAILDGNYGGTMPERLAWCDTVVFLDLPRIVCLWRVFLRRFGDRAGMAAGCPERLDSKFLRWIWEYPSTRRPGLLDLLDRASIGTRVVRLRSRGQVEGFLREVADRATRSGQSASPRDFS